jgi:hypothetical protein
LQEAARNPEPFRFNLFGRQEPEAGPSGLGIQPRRQLLDLNLEENLVICKTTFESLFLRGPGWVSKISKTIYIPSCNLGSRAISGIVL